MRREDYARLVDALLPAVLAAGRIEMAHFTAGVTAVQKADETPVTIADHEAEEALLAGLRTAAPGVPVIAEEEVAAGRTPAIGDKFFLVDPLDGTRAFIRKSPEFTINIGLVEGDRPVFGIIYAPAMQAFFATLPIARWRRGSPPMQRQPGSPTAPRATFPRASPTPRPSSPSPAARTRARTRTSS
jgi:3'(2'), 5'-bisphosphate nucleotidase